MTEEQWPSCTDPTPMLEFLWSSGRASDRKLRLFAAACCRHIWPLVEDERSREAVAVAERVADGPADAGHVARVAEGADQANRLAYYLDQTDSVDIHASGAAFNLVGAGPFTSRRADAVADQAAECVRWSWWAVGEAGTAHAEREVERRSQASLLRCVFGNPVRPAEVDPAWLAWHGGAIVRLAQAVYDERELPSGHLDAARLAVLADMLGEAGCVDAELLTHLRAPGPHVRGCWAVDLLLNQR
jgi:hypothetical protein